MYDDLRSVRSARKPSPEETTLLPSSSTRRFMAVAALALGMLALAWALRPGASHQYRVELADAGQLVKGDLVRVGGVQVGLVRGVGLGAADRAIIDIDIDSDYGPLHQGSIVTIRAPGLTSVASRYVDVSPAPGFKPTLDEGATLPIDKTTSIVEIDQLFNTLEPKTRKGLAAWIKGSADWYEGKELEANRSAPELPKALSGLRGLAAQITRDDDVFRDFLVTTSQAMGTLSDHRTELTALVGNARTSARSLSADTSSLSSALTQLPPALRQGRRTMIALRPAIDDLERLADATGPATRELTPFLAQLRPVAERAVPTFARLRAMLAQPGKSNDLLDAMRDLPPLAALVEQTFPNAKQALRDGTPIFGHIRPYTPDLVAWTGAFGGAMGAYDANGHYARTMPVFDAFSLKDDAAGGSFTPKLLSQRGAGGGLSLGNLRRCPGSAAPAPADGSAPFVDGGPLANPDCDPTQVPRALP